MPTLGGGLALGEALGQGCVRAGDGVGELRRGQVTGRPVDPVASRRHCGRDDLGVLEGRDRLGLAGGRAQDDDLAGLGRLRLRVLLVLGKGVAAEQPALGHGTYGLGVVAAEGQRNRRGIGHGAGSGTGGSPQRGPVRVLAEADEHDERRLDQPSARKLHDLAALAGHAERRQQGSELAAPGPRDVLGSGSRHWTLGRLHDPDDYGVGSDLGWVGTSECVRRHRRMVARPVHSVLIRQSRRGRFGAMADPTLLRSPLHDRHEALGAKFAEFGGWSMPLEYSTGVVKEHTAVRESVGIFDVSHLGKVMVTGPGAATYVNATLSNDLAQDRPWEGSVHAVLRRGDRRHRRRPDRLLPGRRTRPAGPERGELRRGRPPAGGDRARGRARPQPSRRVRRPRGPGHQVGRGADEGRPAGRPRLHELRGGDLRRRRRRGLPHRLHR